MNPFILLRISSLLFLVLVFGGAVSLAQTQFAKKRNRFRMHRALRRSLDLMLRETESTAAVYVED
jgi:Flp pilus assembly protein TadB